ncbi:MAG: EAL domain-containing protein [Thainema sp.]
MQQDLAVLLTIAIALGIYADPAQSAAEPLRVGVYQNQPKVFINPAGDPAGFWVDVLDSIAGAENWSLEYVPCEWDACLQALEQGQLDLMMDVAYSEERDRRFDFNQEVVLASWSEVYARSGLELESVLDLDHRRVAVLRDSIQQDILVEQTHAFGIKPEFEEATSFDQMFQLLDQGQVDAVAVNNVLGLTAAAQHDMAKTNILLGPSRLHFIVPDGSKSDLLAVLDEQIRMLKASPDSAYYQALERWLEPEQRLGWPQIKAVLIDLAIYAPLVGLVAIALWNRLLRQEVNQRKQAEAALRESEQRFRNMAANVPGAIFRYLLHPDGSDKVIYMSPGCYDLWEVEAAAVEQDASILWRVVHPDDQAPMYESVLASARTLQPWFWQWRISTPSGKTKWLEAAGRPERRANGDVVWDTLIMDVSDRKRTEAELQASEVRYRKVVEAQTDFILRSQPDTTITFANPSLCRALGITLSQIVGKKWVDFANPDDLEQDAFRRLAELTPDNPRCFVENRDTRADGQDGWTQWLNEGIFDAAGQLIEIQSVGRDITDLKQTEAALRQSEERLRMVTENMSDLVCLHRPDGRYLYVTPSSQALLGYSPAELIGRDPYELFHPDDCDRIRQSADQFALPDSPEPITYRIRHKLSHYIWVETLTQPIWDEAGHIRHLQTTSRDVSARIRVEQQLKHNAFHDRLTGLPNRSLLMQRLDLALKRSKRHADSQFAVLFLDLDNFKVVNDSLGHLVGDELLLTIATLLRRFIRETDLAARLGGDEFVILLEEISGITEAVMIAERILVDLKSPLSISGRDVFVSTSIGIAINTSSHHQAEDLIRDADLAMYRAKHSGKSQYAIYDPAMHFQAMQRLHLESDLRKALDRQEFILYYQPIIELKTQTIQGFEALLRWQHPQRGWVSPADFIQLAEETGLIIPIGEWILQTTCRQLTQWQAQFPERALRISVNLSVRQLQDLLLQHLDDALQASELANPNTLVLEITESMLVKNVDATLALLDKIKAKGIRLSIDDFGTGYSSLSYLYRLPVDYLKIDRTFVNPVEPDARHQVIAESIVALSNLLELSAIAEGIETIEQLQWLQTLGCELGQGYLFSPPVPAEQATTLLQQSIQSFPNRR